jgi:aryl-alcohol dehydrogenase-like predicted oxidoreductase
MSKNGFVHRRRGFLEGILGGMAAAAFPSAARSETPSPAADIPMRVLGKTGVRVTTIGLGGARLPMLSDDEAVRVVDAAYDAGINFFDNARSYTDGRSERVYGRALQGKRKNIFITSKTTERTNSGAERELEESLGHLKTDYLDLWQIHSVSTKDEVEQIFGPDGALEAFVRAKKAGKARFIGFTGHHDPEVHAAMLERFDFDTILMPLHAADPHYLSFEARVLARAAEKNMGITAMKVTGNAMLLRAVTVDECLRYVLSLPVACAIMGCTTVGQLEDDLRVARSFSPLSEEERKAILAKSERVKGPALEDWKKNTEGSTVSVDALDPGYFG